MDIGNGDKLMAQIDQLQKVHCPLKSNRRDERWYYSSYQRLDELIWSAEDLHRVSIKVRGFPKKQEAETLPGHCFTNGTDYVAPTTILKLPPMLYKMCATSVEN